MNMSEAVVNSNSITRKPGAFEKRIHEIDFARGILIALVIMDHLFNWFAQDGTFDWAWADYYWTCMGREVVRLVVLFLFVFISGISTAFSRNNWKRAGELLEEGLTLSDDQLGKLEKELSDYDDLKEQYNQMKAAKEQLESEKSALETSNRTLTAERDEYKAKWEAAPAPTTKVDGSDNTGDNFDVTDNATYEQLEKLI